MPNSVQKYKVTPHFSDDGFGNISHLIYR